MTELQTPHGTIVVHGPVVHHPDRYESPVALGWHQFHDERSRPYGVSAVPVFDPKAPIKGRSWKYGTAPLNQGQLGSCTGNAEEKRVCSMRKALGLRCRCTEGAAVKRYSLATHLDPFPATIRPPTPARAPSPS
jgi:hypothetical protein